MYRLDFAALIRTAGGEERHVVIEIQKAKFAADIMRFRRYLGEQYKKGFPVAGEKVPKAIPIISIYFLGYRLDHGDAPVIKILRRYYDAATGEEIPAREEFIESLTHNSFVIQIPQLGPERRTATEKLLAITVRSPSWTSGGPWRWRMKSQRSWKIWSAGWRKRTG